MSLRHIHLAVALGGAVAANERFGARFWLDQVQRAEAGLLDFVTIEDGFSGPDRLDASLIAARVAPTTSHIGIVPTVTTTHTEPFHVSKTIATLDYASTGRAGWHARIGAPTAEAPLFGRRESAELQLDSVLAEAADHVEVVRRLWDSWEDDAEIRDAATGRFIDREKLNYIDFVGARFSVRGPSITPRPPQGQPLVIAGAHAPIEHAFAARSADIALVAPHVVDEIPGVVREIRAAQAEAGRGDDRLLIFGDLAVFLDDDPAAAIARKERLDDAAGTPERLNIPVFVGSPSALADQLASWAEAGLDGFRLRPGTVQHDLAAVTDGLVSELQTRGLFRRSYEADTLRGLLGFERPANRYATAAA
ncbi:LLM class flavin-dependent oxidoreductase [Actinospica sp.]|jgi:alkanesulfonate monooxygenase SsuD/methylene tetrahydromethanopterin reductase-like flavin-dependent oxidoreductase (luciferase family)|uniref:LLM class flavin-dependent oxidoreductase n=1 Tax=Actinospica sp. TaxID=1872142 RepID=UPI002D04575E|nr:LLM class flavin-dependent oxidoreductase [Actinospica sp.]HWG23988.1 LLM class flavin-dependent oxidoreductase [Actinospica sp.]